MGEVRYSINGKYFKDRKVYVSDSEGLFDALKRKKINTYDWEEYHGQSVDLSNPKYEAREITLKCFVVGDNWVDMKENHDAIVSEFQKSGTQRLLIEPFGMKPLPYEVYMEDSSPLEKTFKDGQMVGVFTLKLIEPNPIKKVLYTTLDTLNLSYNSSKETEIFFVNGEKTTAKGNVYLSGKTLTNRVVSGYNFSGRNLLLNTSSDWILFSGRGYGLKVFTKVVAKVGETFTGKVFVRNSNSPTPIVLEMHELNSSFERLRTSKKSVVNRVVELTTTVIVPETSYIEMSLFFGDDYGPTTYQYEYSKPKLEKGTVATPYSVAPEDEKYIIIAGDIDVITNLTTNATVLWEKL